mgnify:CR=1 FL=1
MKKFVSILLVLVLMMSLSVAAFADGKTPAEASPAPTTATLAKVVTVTNDGTKMPGQTFSFEVGKVSVTDAAADVTLANMPVPTVDSVTYAEGESGSKTLTINLPEYTSVGVYTYTITENAGSTAGMVYDTASRTLKVTVVNGTTEGTFAVAGTVLVGTDNKKSDSFNNEYQAGSLEITKTVTGNLGDKSKDFTFTVTLNAPEGKTVSSTIKVAGRDASFVSGQTYTFTLKHGESYTFGNLPYGVTYEVVEADYTAAGYTTTKTGDTGTIGAATQTAAFINDKNDGNLDLGVSMDSLPYILMLVVVGAAVVVIATRKKGEQF